MINPQVSAEKTLIFGHVSTHPYAPINGRTKIALTDNPRLPAERLARTQTRRVFDGVSLGTMRRMVEELPTQFNKATTRTIELIDVLWLKGNSIVAAFEVLILLLVMVWRDHKLLNGEFWSGIVRIFSVTGFTILTTYTMVTLVPLLQTDRGFSTLGTKLILIIVPSMAVHIGISSLFGLEESMPVTRKLKQIVLKPVRLEY